MEAVLGRGACGPGGHVYQCCSWMRYKRIEPSVILDYFRHLHIAEGYDIVFKEARCSYGAEAGSQMTLIGYQNEYVFWLLKSHQKCGPCGERVSQRAAECS